MVNLPRRDKENLLLKLGITFQHGALFDSLKFGKILFLKFRINKNYLKSMEEI